MGQIGEMGRQPQAILAQLEMVDSGTQIIRGLQGCQADRQL